MLFRKLLKTLEASEPCFAVNKNPFFPLLQANSQACQGKYASSGASAAGGESLFVANHAY